MRARVRKLLVAMVDAALLTVSFAGAFVLRLGWSATLDHGPVLLTALPVVVLLSLLVHWRMGLFRSIFRYASLETAVNVAKAAVISTSLAFVVLFSMNRLDEVPRAVLLIHAMGSTLLVGGARIAFRWQKRSSQGLGGTTPILLYGVDDTTEWVIRGLRTTSLDFYTVGIINEDRGTHGRQVLGVKIHGGLTDLGRIAKNVHAKELWVCIPGMVGEPLRRVYDAARDSDLRIKVLPTLESALLGAGLDKFHEPDISDLLRRPPRSLDRERVRKWIQSRRVLITGAGGSIGAELARQIVALGPESVALCDACEYNLFEIHKELGSENSVLTPYMVDVRSRESVRRMFAEVRPEVVFHAAAYKHVPLVETNPCEGVLTNVQGVYNVTQAAIEFETEDFVFISTDKAVRPVNVMGATKRLGEQIIQLSDRHSNTRFSAVRFGNVLGSSGSVVPIFKDQVRRGGPVTVTHHEMTRFFMLVSEAVELVAQAGSIARGGEVFVLDMGEPVKIIDMARDLIRLMGQSEREVPIEVTGVRPGEKIHEELLVDSSDRQTSFQDIWIDGQDVPDRNWADFQVQLQNLFRNARASQREDTLLGIQSLVAEYEPEAAEVVEEGNRAGSKDSGVVPDELAHRASEASKERWRPSKLTS